MFGAQEALSAAVQSVAAEAAPKRAARRLIEGTDSSVWDSPG